MRIDEANGVQCLKVWRRRMCSKWRPTVCSGPYAMDVEGYAAGKEPVGVFALNKKE